MSDEEPWLDTDEERAAKGLGPWTQMDDPAYFLLTDGHTSTPVEGLYRATCYICRDPEFAQMGLPLCYACHVCGGHVPADDTICENGHDQEDRP